MVWSDDLIQEQALLVAKSVRPLAILGAMSLDESEMDRQYSRLNQISSDRAIPFVLPRQDMDCAMAGFAAEQWVVDLLAWSYANAPLQQHHRIIGLLLGYSPRDIAEHDFREFAGRPTSLFSTETPADIAYTR